MNPAQKPTDIRVVGVQLFFLPVETRMPIKFGPEVFTKATYARVRLTVKDRAGGVGEGWGETPLSIQWCWPSSLSYSRRHDILLDFCRDLAKEWSQFLAWGHPLEVGSDFLDDRLMALHKKTNQTRPDEEAVPYLAALVCASAFDLALHDAYGNLHQQDI